MSTQQPTHFINQYTNNITILQQQMFANLRNAVDTETVNGEFAFFDQVAATSMSEITTRHGDTELTDTIHRRRRVGMQDFGVADMIDNADKVRTLNDPTNPYVRQFASAAGRQTDDLIIAAFDATVSTGKTGTGSDAFDTGTYQIAAGGTNLTTDKLRTARKILEAAENPEDDSDNQWYVVCSANQRAALLADSEYQNSDFNSVKALVDGNVDDWLGFKFLKSERLSLSTNDRSCWAWRKASMKLAIGADPTGFIDVIPTKNHSTQVRYAMTQGAVRMDQVGVVEIICDETA